MINYWKCIIFISFFPGVFPKNSLEYLMKDIVVSYGRSAIVTMFSCRKIESVNMLKLLSASGHQSNVLPVDTKDLPRVSPPHHVVFILDLQCRKAEILINRANQAKLFNFPFKWIVYSNEETSLEDYFSSIDLLVDSDLLMVKKGTNNFVLEKLYKTGTNSEELIKEFMGNWSEDGGLDIVADFEMITARRRRNLRGINVKSCLVITHNDSLNHLTDKRDKHIDSIAKVNYVLVGHLSDINNMSLSYTIQDTWGYKNNKSQWSGMIGELTRKEADIGSTPLFLTSDRVDIIDYIAMTTPTRSKFVFRQPKLSYVTNVYTLPFHISVWISTIALVLITSLVLFIVMKWEWNKKKYVKIKETGNVSELRADFSDVAFLSFGALCQQGASVIPFSPPGRMTTIFLFISLMFLYTSYSANIVALLQSSSNSIQTLEDLLKSRLQVGVDDTVFNQFYFPNATEPIRKAIYQQKVAPPGKPARFMQIEEGVRRMRQGLFAFHMETGAGYKIVSETFHEAEKCGLQEIQFLQVPDPWLAIQKNSSYKEMFKIGLHLIQESGLQTREVGLIYSKKPLCISRGSSFISVGLVDCYPTAVVLAAGIILAGVVFVLEAYVHYRVLAYQEKQLSFLGVDGTKTVENIEHPLSFFR